MLLNLLGLAGVGRGAGGGGADFPALVDFLFDFNRSDSQVAVSLDLKGRPDELVFVVDLEEEGGITMEGGGAREDDDGPVGAEVDGKEFFERW